MVVTRSGAGAEVNPPAIERTAPARQPQRTRKASAVARATLNPVSQIVTRRGKALLKKARQAAKNGKLRKVQKPPIKKVTQPKTGALLKGLNKALEHWKLFGVLVGGAFIAAKAVAFCKDYKVYQVGEKVYQVGEFAYDNSDTIWKLFRAAHIADAVVEPTPANVGVAATEALHVAATALESVAAPLAEAAPQAVYNEGESAFNEWVLNKLGL